MRFDKIFLFMVFCGVSSSTLGAHERPQLLTDGQLQPSDIVFFRTALLKAASVFGPLDHLEFGIDKLEDPSLLVGTRGRGEPRSDGSLETVYYKAEGGEPISEPIKGVPYIHEVSPHRGRSYSGVPKYFSANLTERVMPSIDDQKKGTEEWLRKHGWDSSTGVCKGVFDKIREVFPFVNIHNVNSLTPTGILETLKAKHPYDGYIFQEPSVFIKPGYEDYAATTNSAGPCMALAVLNSETGAKGVYHTNAPLSHFTTFLKVIDKVAEGDYKALKVVLATGFLKTHDFIVADGLNEMLKIRGGQGLTLESFGKVGVGITHLYQSKEEADSETGGNFAVGLTAFDKEIHFLRDSDTMSIFPRVSFSTDSDLWTEYDEGRMSARLDSKRPDGVSDEEWEHYKKISNVFNTSFKPDFKSDPIYWQPGISGVEVDIGNIVPFISRDIIFPER